MILLPDVIVWLALTFDSHVHDLAAKSWFDALPGDLAYSAERRSKDFCD